MNSTTMTTTLLDTMINEQLAVLPDNDFNALVEVMALIDYRYNFENTCEQYNMRLRNLVKNNFNKGFLTDDTRSPFREWETKLEGLHTMATRSEIFSLAPEKALHIVGI